MKLPNPFIFAGAVGRVVWAFVTRRPLLVSRAVQIIRKRECEMHPRTCFDPYLRQCKECSCFVDAKTRLATEKCPLGYWKRVFRKESLRPS